MRSIILLSYSFIVSFTIAQTIFAQTAQIEQPFIFSDEFNNTQELIIGYDPYGSNGLDPDLGEVFVPQVPTGEFGVRFQLPTDTSITTIKDIRFGCGQPFYYEHLIDLSYIPGSSIIGVDWEWSFELWIVHIIDPYTGQTLLTLESFFDPSYYSIPPMMEKIIFGIQYNGPLSWLEYEVITPNGGELIPGGHNYIITWWDNNLFPWVTSIDFSTDSGATWSVIADTVWSASNTYDWDVPQVSSDECLIRLGSYPCAYDQSDSVFTITYPVSIDDKQSLPTEFSLEQNYPNPFNPTTTIKYTIPQSVTLSEVEGSLVTLIIYDVLGNEIAILVNEEKSARSYEVEFNGIDLPGGIYFYRLQAGGFTETKKMILLK